MLVKVNILQPIYFVAALVKMMAANHSWQSGKKSGSVHTTMKLPVNH